VDKAVWEAGGCLYYIDVYPSNELYLSFQTGRPTVYTSVIALIFFIMIMTFFIFNWFIQQRNKKIVLAAARSHAIVSAMFPTSVRDRLFGAGAEKKGNGNRHVAPTTELKDFLTGGEKSDLDDEYMFKTKPIADLFPEVSYVIHQVLSLWKKKRYIIVLTSLLLFLVLLRLLSCLPISLVSRHGALFENHHKCSRFLKQYIEPLIYLLETVVSLKLKQWVIAMWPYQAFQSRGRTMLW
jgi:hypothetical protein